MKARVLGRGVAAGLLLSWVAAIGCSGTSGGPPVCLNPQPLPPYCGEGPESSSAHFSTSTGSVVLGTPGTSTGSGSTASGSSGGGSTASGTNTSTSVGNADASAPDDASNGDGSPDAPDDAVDGGTDANEETLNGGDAGDAHHRDAESARD